MNAAVLMLTACLAGADPVPAAQPYGQVPVVVYGNGGGYGDCCGRSSVCGNCDSHHECCLTKIWRKLSCFSCNFCGSGNGCNTGHSGCNLCNRGQQSCAPACPKPVCNPCPAPKPVCNPCPKPVCNPCPKPVCNPCPRQECAKPVCTKVQPECHTPSCGTICWTPGYCLHKCKEKLSGLCGNRGGCGCHGGCGTAATPNACGSTTIAPGTAVPVAPPAEVPVAPKAMPESQRAPTKVGSAYGIVRPELTTDGSTPRTIDLTPTPF